MAQSEDSKKQILQAISKALQSPVPLPFPKTDAEQVVLFAPAQDDLAVIFAQTFTGLQGQFSYCMDLSEVVQQVQLMGQKRGMEKWHCNDAALQQRLEAAGWPFAWHPTLHDCHASLTACEALVARTGSMVLSSTASSGRTTSVYAPIHICVAYSHQLVYDVSDALQKLHHKYGGNLPSQISFASGPSRTADIEKTLVTGVHGPKEVFCFFVEEG